MEDKAIIALYWKRDEEAIVQTHTKYGRYLGTIAYHILDNKEDCKECVNDTYFRVWDAIPSDKPSAFRAYIGKITRNLSLKRYAGNNAQKRGGGEVAMLLDELMDCISANENVEKEVEASELVYTINEFLRELSEEHRALFVRRYWYAHSIREISVLTGYSESKIKSILFRLRAKLKLCLNNKGVEI